MEEKTMITPPPTDAPPSLPAFPDRSPRRRHRDARSRTKKLTVRLNDSEEAEITAVASARAMTVGRFIATSALSTARGLSADHDPQDRLDRAVDELAAARAHLARVGNNANQIAHQLNAGGYPRPGELDAVLAAVRQAVAAVDRTANQLVGG
ncbi:plasmid mobilization relaxosome protein MobC [Kitasatospora sp. NPDC004669]|uniref:plasmid mobilization protein n=1 Tax=Kitasatospora sp. NPDC004669 TaxID=3154555 RepID=UPI0033ACC8BB